MSRNLNFVLKIIQKWQLGKIENEFIKISFYKGNNFYCICHFPGSHPGKWQALFNKAPSFPVPSLLPKKITINAYFKSNLNTQANRQDQSYKYIYRH